MTDPRDATRPPDPARVDVEARIEIPSQPSFLAPLRAFVTCLAERVGFDEIAQFQIALAVDEAVANIINHGYGRRPDGRIWLHVARIENARPGLRFVLDDDGRQVDPDSIRSRSLDEVRPGGLGVHIIREVMDECRWERRSAGGMRVTLVKFLSADAASATAARECSSSPKRTERR